MPNHFKIPGHISFECPFCSKIVYASEFPNHCFSKHNLSEIDCSWCFGHSNLGQCKKHASACFEQFMKAIPRKPPPVTFEDRPILFNFDAMCKAAQPSTYPLPLINLKSDNGNCGIVPFAGNLLNVAVASVHEFLKDDADWFHLMVRETSWESFRDVVQKENVQMLPFTCVCKGGNCGDHRHLLIKSQPKNHFVKAVWKKVPRKNTHVRKQMIETPMDLVEAIDSLSQEESTCDFSFQPGYGAAIRNRSNVAVSLPRLHKIVLALQWEGGIIDYFRKEFASLEPLALAPVAFLSSGIWVVKMRDLLGIMSNLMLPVTNNFQPSHHETKYYVHLQNGRKFYFEEAQEMDLDKWIRVQIERGNFLSNLVGDCLYYPTLSQHQCIKLIKPCLEDVETLQGAFEDKLTEVKTLQESVNKLKSTNVSLKRKFNRSEKELKLLQQKHINYLEQENDHLRMKHENLKKRKLCE